MPDDPFHFCIQGFLIRCGYIDHSIVVGPLQPVVSPLQLVSRMVVAIAIPPGRIQVLRPIYQGSRIDGTTGYGSLCCVLKLVAATFPA